MAKVTRAAVIIETAGSAEFAIFKNAHTRISETANFTLLCAVCSDFHYGSSCNFLGTKHPELYAHNGLRLRTMRKNWQT